MKLAISSGHGLKVRGASGYLDEVNEARKVVDRVNDLWNQNGVTSVKFHDDTSTSQSQNLNTIVVWHNKQSRDYDVSVHFNAYQTTSKPMGVEVLYVTQQKLAADTSAAISRAGSFINRGAKKRTDLAFLNGTSKPAVLLEVCFVDSSADADLYRRNFDAICNAITEVIGQVSLSPTPPEPLPPDPPVPDETARIDITIKSSGGPCIISINGQDFMGPVQPEPPQSKT